MRTVSFGVRIITLWVLGGPSAALCQAPASGEDGASTAVSRSTEARPAGNSSAEASPGRALDGKVERDTGADSAEPKPSIGGTVGPTSVTGASEVRQGDGQPVLAGPEGHRGAPSAAPVATDEKVETASPAHKPPRPRRQKTRFPFRIQVEFMPVWQLSKGFDFFSDQDISRRVGLAAGYDLLELTPKTAVSVDLGWSTESLRDEALFQGFETFFRAHNLQAGVSVRHHLSRYFAPYAAVSLGASAMKVKFTSTDSSREREYETTQWAPFGTLGLGVATMLPIELLMLGASAEGGYLISGSMPLRLEPELEGQRLTTKGASLGTLGRSGPYLRFAIFCRF
ncbi:MAG TPA: hypothetical protein VKP30_33935 [Polyangiaceae bacterium]|nr:hypothetical protein [Polyangiaceae bacterium]